MTEATASRSHSGISEEDLRRAPKVLLHDHLDGGLRPETIIELAAETGYAGLPTTDADELRTWFYDASNSGSLVRYLETFEHTIGVMQTPPAIERVAREAVADLAADGVVYAEVRFAPELFTRAGLTIDAVVASVCAGFREACQDERSRGRAIDVRALVCGMRQADRVGEAFEAAVAHRDTGVVGVDIAGPELGFPPSLHKAAFDSVAEENMHVTVHAGEADGPGSVWEAIHVAGAERLGHGVRLLEDVTPGPGDSIRLGRLAQYVLDRGIALEVAPTSNLQTGIAGTMVEHPIGLLYSLGFAVTVNTDNRLMSDCSVTSELAAVTDAFGWSWADVAQLQATALQASFLPFHERERLSADVLVPFYAAVT